MALTPPCACEIDQAMRGATFIGMVLTVPCLALLGPLVGGILAPGQSTPLPGGGATGRSYQFPKQPQTISGFHYQVSTEGRKVLSFAGNRLSLQNKKIGFLRFALLREIRVEQGTFIIQQSPAKEENTGNGTAPSRPLASLAGLLAVFPHVNASSLVCQPVSITFVQQETGSQSLITAKSARIESDAPTIHFTGKVQLSTGDLTLTAEALDLIPADDSIVARNYTLTTARGKSQGQQLQSNIFLTATQANAADK